MTIKTLQAFTQKEKTLAGELLSAKIATMLGRKMEEADWDFVYCNSKRIPITNWSNLNIDINHNGLGVEHKMLRIANSRSILYECGTTKMHPAGTRSIRIPNEEDPNKAMTNILHQYGKLIQRRTDAVIKSSAKKTADMRFGWLLWKESLEEFLYFEEAMVKPIPEDYVASWNVTPARGARKESRSLWIYERKSGNKKYSVTTSAGAKIQPYFDVPMPDDPFLYHFKVQGVILENGLVEVWLTRATARYLELLVGSLDTEALSAAIEDFDYVKEVESETVEVKPTDIAVPVRITRSAYRKLREVYEPKSDEYLFQQFVHSIGSK